MADAAWLSEAVVEFLKGPMYINPLMSFIDERCLIFTPEEENKLEYTTCHNEFKDLVDRLLTDFLADLGVGPDDFYQTVAAAQETDQLTSFVVQTILTVDDFLMFKAMMVRRNIDLTTQVLEAVEQAWLESQASAGTDGAGEGSVSSLSPKLTEQEEEVLREAMELSARLQAEWAEADRLQKAMRTLQLEDEDVALPAAIAASLREQAKFDSELADIEQAIALSLALEEERRRLASQGGPAPAAAAKAAERAPLPPVKGAPTGAAAPPPPAAAAAPAAADAPAAASPRTSKFVPAPIDAPTGSVGAKARGKGAGYKSEASGVDLEAIRKAAQQAAESQKKLIGKGDGNDEASKWLQEAKKKLIAQKQADREQEMEEYKAAGKSKAGAGAGGAASADDAKRAALREALAQKMKQNIMLLQQ
ncbi:hypothetical protein PLESTB_001378900 [Pleodorina starrii]|uniref:Cilia- and flagella-associated protein 36 n=1 Tax=Pleodorina starrii TaxID=330485 RepID=A0A9W6BUT7_9CHLO|nr:hypothetical protein PLESTM_000406300 [Pleodorina starrii]GLC58599.1 hypothetical protein PLESTB_001378900 [Pleodorina starrii]GLC67494.1 hypothetical protein PLESTF_000563500 [Pleodorina starrii]